MVAGRRVYSQARSLSNAQPPFLVGCPVGVAPGICHGTAESSDPIFPSNIQEHCRELAVLAQQPK